MPEPAPIYKELPEVVVTAPRKKPMPTPSIPTPPKPKGPPSEKRILGIPESAFFGLLGILALSGMIWTVTRKTK